LPVAAAENEQVESKYLAMRTECQDPKYKDQLWRLNNLYHIMDEDGNDVLFVMNDVQVQLYDDMWWNNLVLKSRQHGITTFLCVYFLDCCLFEDNIRAGIIAHKLTDAKKIFRDKIKYAYKKLPLWIQEANPVTKDDAGELMFEHNSGIYVATSMRSGTLQLLHVSEYGYICRYTPNKAREIKSGAMETVHAGGMIFVESTAEGMGNDFHAMSTVAEQLKLAGKQPNSLQYSFHFYPWFSKGSNTMDPEGIEIRPEVQKYLQGIEGQCRVKFTPGQKAWYQSKKDTLKSDMWKEHPSISAECFYASLEGAYYGEEMALLREKGNIRRVPYDPSVKVFTFWDLGNIYTALIYVQFIGEKINVIDCTYDELGQGLPYFAKVLQDKPYIYGDHYGGPDIDPQSGSNAKSVHTGRTTIEHAYTLGIKFKVVEAHRVDDRIRECKDILGPDPRVYFDEAAAEMVYTALTQYRRRKNEQLSTEEKPVFHDEPVHDWTSHLADAFGHLAIQYRVLNILGERFGRVTQDHPQNSQSQTKHDTRAILRQCRRRARR
jgi:hypothetical protein